MRRPESDSKLASLNDFASRISGAERPVLVAIAALLLLAPPALAQRPATTVPKAPIQPDPLSGAVPQSLFLTAEQKQILSHLSLVDLPDGNGGTVKAIRVSGINVQIVNGLGATNGNPSNPTSLADSQAVINGAGNVILGYHEAAVPNFSCNSRTGSHHLVFGQRGTYESFGGVVGGRANQNCQALSTITAGQDNLIVPLVFGDDYGISVSGGGAHGLGARGASASGGYDGTVQSRYSSMSGGTNSAMTYNGFADSQSGGGDHYFGYASAATASGGFDCFLARGAPSITGGTRNRVGGNPYYSGGRWGAVTGGEFNAVDEDTGSVSGGQSGRVLGDYASISGGRRNTAGTYVSSGIYRYAYYATIAGGEFNVVNGSSAAISGGQSRSAAGDDDWVAGTLSEDD